MHYLYVGISKQLRVVKFDRLSFSASKSSTIKNASGECQAFLSKLRKVLYMANNILRYVQDESGIRAAFSTMTDVLSYNGLFKETGLVGMLNARDFKTVDLDSPFLSATIDHLCGKQDAALVTNVVVEYGDITVYVYCRKGSVGPSGDDLEKLLTRITAFECKAGEVLQEFQPSKMRTVN